MRYCRLAASLSKDSFQGNDLAEDACAPVILTFRRSHAEKVPAPHAKIDLTYRRGVVLRPLPAHQLFRIGPGFPDQRSGSIENAGDHQLTVLHFVLRTIN
jgi:hypothetical protein